MYSLIPVIAILMAFSVTQVYAEPPLEKTLPFTSQALAELNFAKYQQQKKIAAAESVMVENENLMDELSSACSSCGKRKASGGCNTAIISKDKSASETTTKSQSKSENASVVPIGRHRGAGLTMANASAGNETSTGTDQKSGGCKCRK
jgi:hypothetical protein